MKVFEDEFDIDDRLPKVMSAYFPGMKVASFDIETTGLFARNDYIMLTGILTAENGKAHSIQFFAEDPSDEKTVIEHTLSELSKSDYLLTYNGRSFDVPFTLKRAQKHGIEASLPYDLDLYLILNAYSDIKKFTGSLSQKKIEQYMGLASSRDDKIDGYESIRLYNQYLESPSFDLEKKIVLHNHDDICQLYKLLPVLRQTDVDKAMFNLGFPAGGFTVRSIKANLSGMSINAVKEDSPVDYISFPTEELPLSIRMDSSTGETDIDIPGEVLNKDNLVIDCETILKGLPCGSQNDDDQAAAPKGNSALEVSGSAATPEEIISELEKYPSFENGYLIAKSGGKINYFEINLFVRKLFESLKL